MIELNQQEVEALKKIAQDYIEKEKSQSIDSLTERAKYYKKLATERFPKCECEIYVDEDTKSIVINFPKEDSSWNNIKRAELIIYECKMRKEETVSRRIYV
jgi:hypothetical protein